MKPLSERTKAFAYRYLADGPARPLAAAAWRGLLAAEAGLLALLPTPRDDGATDDVTAVIKTFERPRRCAALIASMRRRYPALRIVVVDDSRVPGDWPGAETVRMPFDSGVGRGRQAGLERVRTPFVLNLDDDFLFYSGTRLGAAAAMLRAEPRIDLLGGIVIDLPLFITHDFRRSSLAPVGREPKSPLGTRIGPAEVMDKVPNFFLARADAVRAVGWDPALKRLDHADFFARARGRLTSAQWRGFKVLHRRDPFDRGYLAFRNDLAADRALLAGRYPG